MYNSTYAPEVRYIPYQSDQVASSAASCCFRDASVYGGLRPVEMAITYNCSPDLVLLLAPASTPKLWQTRRNPLQFLTHYMHKSGVQQNSQLSRYFEDLDMRLSIRECEPCVFHCFLLFWPGSLAGALSRQQRHCTVFEQFLIGKGACIDLSACDTAAVQMLSHYLPPVRSC